MIYLFVVAVISGLNLIEVIFKVRRHFVRLLLPNIFFLPFKVLTPTFFFQNNFDQRLYRPKNSTSYYFYPIYKENFSPIF